MTLPKLLTAQFTTKQPSTGKTINFRPFLVKEEKILLMALEGNDNDEIVNALERIIEACVIGEIDVKNLPSFDLEYLFLKLRSKSVGEQITVKLTHEDKNSVCQHYEEVMIDLDKIEVNFPEGHTNKIQLTDTVGLEMRYPSLNVMQEVQKTQTTNQVDALFNLTAKSIKLIYDKDNVYSDFTTDEAVAFIESMSEKQFKDVMNFFNTLPKLHHTVNYTCSECGKAESIDLEGIRNFFM